MKTGLKLSLLGAAMAFSLSAHALIVIDNFSDGTVTRSVTSGAPSNSFSQSGLSGVLGGVRQSDLTYISGDPVGSGDATIRVDAHPTAGTYSFDQGSGTSARARLWWDGDATAGVQTAGLGGVNFSAAASAFSFRANTEISANPNPYKILLKVWDTAVGLSTFEFTAVDTGGTYVTFNIPFAAFAGTADFSSVGALMVEFNTNATARVSVDVSLRSVQAVPEPAAISLVSLALIGLWATSRRRKV